jgi:hypothetical protein
MFSAEMGFHKIDPSSSASAADKNSGDLVSAGVANVVRSASVVASTSEDVGAVCDAAAASKHPSNMQQRKIDMSFGSCSKPDWFANRAARLQLSETGVQTRVARFFSTQNTKLSLNYQMAIKNTKWP